MSSIAVEQVTQALELVAKAEEEKRKLPTPRAAKSVAPSFVNFVSREPEGFEFEVENIRPERRMEDRRLIWRVPADLAPQFERHHHVQRNRIVRSDATI